MKIYIAGRITGNPNYREEFAEAEKELKRKGHTVLNPVKPDGFTYKDYIDMGLCELMRCDAVYVLPGYEYSKGALLESHYARVVGLEVIYGK